MNVQVIDNIKNTVKMMKVAYDFDLKSYVTVLFPENDLMIYTTGGELNISVLKNDKIIMIFRGFFSWKSSVTSAITTMA